MKKKYNPQDIENKIYDFWEKKGYFKPNKDTKKESFCVMIPPPNITGSLHMGHAFQQTIMDIMVRYQRMLGKNTLYQVGTDHAGIATQIVVESQISIEKGKTRYDYGREDFINKIWQWQKESGRIITNQIRRLGNSVDWERERFTMDKDFSDAVKKVFVHLYKEKLIYRGKRLVNWDVKLHTAISDLEVENRESKGLIWDIRYPLADNEKTVSNINYLVVSTTRPETLLGDTGVAVNPNDPRYKNLIGKFIMLPIINRRIPIIGDKYADINKGTGCVKITPAHDFNDYKVGCTHHLPMINFLTLDGNVRETAEVFDSRGNKSNVYSAEIPEIFHNLNCLIARKEIVTVLESLGLLEKIKPHSVTLPYGTRSEVIIEPMLTNQWYLRASDILIKPAIEAVKNNEIQFVPNQYKNMYFSWMRDIQDWCISRQLWWGHSIPAWYDEQENVYVGRSEQEVRQENNLSNDVFLRKDNDVLDTWFSSSIWTFASLGWPSKTDFLHQFHPVTVLVSGFDIIFFWITRMIMMTMHFIKDKQGKPQIPFKTVYITGLIRDEEGQKMSKSKGNVMDPIDMIDGISLAELAEKRTKNLMKPKIADKIRERTEKQFPDGIKPHGTDALRFTLAALASTSRDINWDMKRLEGYRNFCNKLWNASRFILINTEKQDCGFNHKEKSYSIVDRWILNELNQTIQKYRTAIDSFRFDIATEVLYEFSWNQFCNWYIEMIKEIMKNSSEIELRGTKHTLITVFEKLLRLAHPIIPFITEYIWKRIKVIADINSDTIMLQPFPKVNLNLNDKKASVCIEWLKKAIVSLRNIRGEMKIPTGKPIELLIRRCNDTALCCVQQNFFKKIAFLKRITILSDDDKNPASVIKIIDGVELMIPISGFTEKYVELKRLEKEVKKIDKIISKTNKKLENKFFIARAPKEIVVKEREKLLIYTKEKMSLIEQWNIISKL